MMETAKRAFRAVALLDRDGTINEEVNYLYNPDQVKLLPDVAQAIAILNSEDVAVVITTNQSGIGRGMFDEAALSAVNEKLLGDLNAGGARIDAIYFCPALPDAGDPRRKPSRGMYDDAVRDLGLAGLPVYSIGDRTLDVEFGVRCSGKGIRVLTGHQLKEDLPLDIRMLHDQRERKLIFTTENLLQAVHVLLADLDAECVKNDSTFHKKFADLYATAQSIAEERAQGNRVVLANGCFDLLHGGHASYLADARALGDRLVVAINSNASVRRLKGNGRPILSESDRLQLLAAIRYVDYLTVFHEDSADRVLEVLRPDIHAKGTDYRSDNVPELETTRRLGIETRIAGNPKENSSRDIIGTIAERARKGLV
ncbi:HAD-IIIA family hydrolase [Candidatus Sumerlaeota bacterium]|nr:HAD-IIIA family hydrolase [Candidatus Sumerlaeota bacterium]